MLSWSMNYGLYLKLDGSRTYYDRRFKRIYSTLEAPGKCYFARPISDTDLSYSQISISDLSIIYAYYTVADELKISLGV